jgi:hypothetical protein
MTDNTEAVLNTIEVMKQHIGQKPEHWNITAMGHAFHVSACDGATAKMFADELMKAGWWRQEDADKFFEWSDKEVAAAEEPTPKDVEKLFNETLEGLAKDRFGAGGAEEIKHAAERSIKRVVGKENLHEAIRSKK